MADHQEVVCGLSFVPELNRHYFFFSMGDGCCAVLCFCCAIVSCIIHIPSPSPGHHSAPSWAPGARQRPPTATCLGRVYLLLFQLVPPSPSPSLQQKFNTHVHSTVPNACKGSMKIWWVNKQQMNWINSWNPALLSTCFVPAPQVPCSEALRLEAQSGPLTGAAS